MPLNPGWIELIYGCVKSGKSRALIDKINSIKNAIDEEKFEKEFLVVKHPLDDKETQGKISSFDGKNIDAIECETAKDLVEHVTKHTKFIFLSGVHLFDRDIVPLLKALVDINVIIVTTGINLTAKGEPYNYMPQIMTITDVYDIRAGECFTSGCGENAYRSIKVNDHFEPRCMKCYYKTEKTPDLVVVTGPMFSQKTLELIAKTKEKERKLELNPVKNEDGFMNKDISAIFKWSEDKRYDLEKIVSHDGNSINAIPIESNSQVINYLKINKQVGFVGFDEIQFFKDPYPLIKELLVGNISSSFLGYNLLYDPHTNNTSGKVIFRYLPEGTLREVSLPIKVTTQPEIVDVSHPDNTFWGTIFTNDCKASFIKEWTIYYDWKEPSYQRELYRSIMSKKGGLTIDDFYVKSFQFSKNSGRLNSKEIESSVGFLDIPASYLQEYPANIINCLSNNTYNQTTVNPGFNRGTSGWNIVSTYSNTGELDSKAHSIDIIIEDTNETIDDPEIKLDSQYIKIFQTNRVPEGKYLLEVSIKSSIPRSGRIFLGETSVEVEIPQSENLKLIKLTDVLNEGILINYNDGIIDYGIELFENENPSTVFLEYCRLKKI